MEQVLDVKSKLTRNLQELHTIHDQLQAMPLDTRKRQHGCTSELVDQVLSREQAMDAMMTFLTNGKIAEALAYRSALSSCKVYHHV